jgi:hypothetical protein
MKRPNDDDGKRNRMASTRNRQLALWRRVYALVYPDWEERRERALWLLDRGASQREIMQTCGISAYMVRSLEAQRRGVLLRQNTPVHRGARADRVGPASRAPGEWQRDMTWAEINRRLSETVRRLEQR